MCVEYCQKAVSASFGIIIRFYISIVNIVFHIDWFVYIEESLRPWVKACLIMMYDPFIVAFYSLVFFKIFASIFISDTDL